VARKSERKKPVHFRRGGGCLAWRKLEPIRDYKLYCRLDIPGEIGFSVTIPPTQDVYDLKKAIIGELPVDHKNTKATELKLYRIDQGGSQELRYSNKLSTVFGPNGPPDLDGADHILVQLLVRAPEGESIVSRACSVVLMYPTPLSLTQALALYPSTTPYFELMTPVSLSRKESVTDGSWHTAGG
jgi:hypothetical protein